MRTIPELQSLVGGERKGGSELAVDLNPARPHEIVANVQLADPSTATDAIQAAKDAFPGWRAMPAPERGELLRKAADLLESRVDPISREFTREEGKTIREAAGETLRAVAILRYYASQTLEPVGDVLPSRSDRTLLYAKREPLGVIVAITPWNFPIAIPAWKIAPALAFGNTVVWKPAELTPLVSHRFVEALVEAGIPPGVINLVLGKSAKVGDRLVEDTDVAAITFTGSETNGRALQRKAIDKGIKVQLELGGKNPAIVLKDADVPFAVEQVARGAFLSAGQKCTATSRVIVQAPLFEEFVDQLALTAASWKVGDPLEAETQVGPVASEGAMRSILGYIDDADRDGGQTLAGGSLAAELGDGYFVRPTVVVGLPAGSKLNREEIFGPVVAVSRAESYEEAVSIANDTRFGLSASLFTRDLGVALRFANDIQAGVVKVNQESAGIEFQAPFGGFKSSSNGGREQGKAAREFMTQWKTVYMDQPPH